MALKWRCLSVVDHFVTMWPYTTCRKVALCLMASQVIVIVLVFDKFSFYQKLRQSISPVENDTEFVPTDHGLASSRQAAERGDKGAFDGETISSNEILTSPTFKTDKISVGVGLAMTTRKLKGISGSDVSRLPFFRSLLKSFCRTASRGFDYQFYVAYDYNDQYLVNQTFHAGMVALFAKYTAQNCPPSSKYSLRFVKCSHTKHPAWAQNDAMIEAYLSGVQFFYRINDDTSMKTPNWTERFIQTLDHFIPERVGVVGPKHRGGNTVILTYDFTHRTHINIHGFYYPREFPDWYADKWITSVYKPGRSVKLNDVILIHTMESGQRYTNTKKARAEVDQQVAKDKANVIRYVNAAQKGFPKRDPKRVVAMSLYNGSAAQSWGAIRNAQLMSVIYSGWTLRVYTDRSLVRRDTAKDGANALLATSNYIPGRIIDALLQLDAKVVYVDSPRTVRPELWSHLVADDPDVDVFLIRKAEARISEREKAVVEHWLASDQPAAVLAIRDHPTHSGRGLIDGLWGARSRGLRSLIGAQTKMRHLIEAADNAGDHATPNALDACLRVIHSKVQNDIVYYDSITCDTPRSVPFPVKRKAPNYVGQLYNEHEQVIVDEKYRILSSRNPRCEGLS